MAGRPSNASKKVETNTVVDTPIIDNIEVKFEKTDVEKENELLKAKLEELTNMMLKLQETTNATTSINEERTSAITPDIDMNARISVTSITTGGVNLKTTTDGTAKVFRFDKLGQTLPIIYVDLINCINLQRSFFEDGLLYINNQKVVEDNYLEEYYKKFINIDKINNIMNFDNETIKNMVSNTTPAIQETICLLVADKINKGEAIDMNKVDIIGKSCKNTVDIRDLANRLR